MIAEEMAVVKAAKVVVGCIISSWRHQLRQLSIFLRVTHASFINSSCP